MSCFLSPSAEKVETALSGNKKSFVYMERKNKTVLSTIESSRRDKKITEEIRKIVSDHKPVSRGVKFDAKNIQTSGGYHPLR